MSIHIKGYDTTGNWSLDDYSLQKGHLAQFHVETKNINCKINKIKWKFCDGEESHEEKPLHMFCQLNSFVPCEGTVWIKVKVTFKCSHKCNHCKKTFKVKKEIVIIPRLLGTIRIEDPITSENDQHLDIYAKPLMEGPEKPTPFVKNIGEITFLPEIELFHTIIDGEDFYLPISELFCTPVEGTNNITTYGPYKFKTMPGIRFVDIPTDLKTFDFYKYNYPIKHGKYPPIEVTHNICPSDISLFKTQYPVDNDIILKLNNVSPQMLPEQTVIDWKIGSDKYVTYGKVTELPYKFTEVKTYHITVVMMIPNCPRILKFFEVTVI